MLKFMKNPVFSIDKKIKTARSYKSFYYHISNTKYS